MPIARIAGQIGSQMRPCTVPAGAGFRYFTIEGHHSPRRFGPGWSRCQPGAANGDGMLPVTMPTPPRLNTKPFAPVLSNHDTRTDQLTSHNADRIAQIARPARLAVR